MHAPQLTLHFLAIGLVCRGQDITSSQSHKSYRPLTVLAFRLTHRTWCLLTAAVPGISQLLAHLPISQLVQDDSRTARPPGKSLFQLQGLVFIVLVLCRPAAGGHYVRMPQHLASQQLLQLAGSPLR
jgi:hypothetical protein